MFGRARLRRSTRIRGEPATGLPVQRHAGVMLVVHVHVSVQPHRVIEFLTATARNAHASLQEPGVFRFDVLQDQSDQTHVVLVEVYRDAEAAAAHKATPHYAIWRDTVAEMMARPRESTKFAPVFPTADPMDRRAVSSRHRSSSPPPAGSSSAPAGRRNSGRYGRRRFAGAGVHRIPARAPSLLIERAGAAGGRGRCLRRADRRRGPGRGRRGQGARRGCGRGHRRRQRARPRQGGGDAAGQRRRPAGLPGGGRPGHSRSPGRPCPTSRCRPRPEPAPR